MYRIIIFGRPRPPTVTGVTGVTGVTNYFICLKISTLRSAILSKKGKINSMCPFLPHSPVIVKTAVFPRSASTHRMKLHRSLAKRCGVNFQRAAAPKSERGLAARCKISNWISNLEPPLSSYSASRPLPCFAAHQVFSEAGYSQRPVRPPRPLFIATCCLSSSSIVRHVIVRVKSRPCRW